MLESLVPHGSREEWLLEAIGVVVTLVLAILVRAGSPRGLRPRLGLVFGALVLNVLFFLVSQVVNGASTQSMFAGLATISIGVALARVVFLFVFDVLLTRNRAQPPSRIVRDLWQGAILFVAALISLRAAGVEPGQLLTTSALLTVVAGMALQETLGNLVAGLAIQTERPFEVGDWIEVHGSPGHIGRVREINWRATRLHTLDNVDVVVPNGLLAKATFTNYDRPHRAARRSIYFHVPYSVPTRVVHEVVLAAVGDSPGVLRSPPASLVTFAFTESGVQYWLRFFLDDMSRRDAIDGGVRDRVWYSLARHGVSLSVPSRTVELHEVSEASAAAKEERAIGARLAALGRIDLFSGLAAEELRNLAARVKAAMFAPGEIVIREGERGDTMFIVVDGEISVRVGGLGPEAEAARLTGGAFFGEMSLLTGDPRKATVVAVSACELFVVDHAAFHALLDAHPNLAQVIGEKVMQRERGLVAKKEASDTIEQVPAHPEGAGDIVQRIRKFFGLRQPQ